MLDDKDRKIKISNSVREFKQKLVDEFLLNFSNIEYISSKQLDFKLKEIASVDYIYPCVGDNDDFIRVFEEKNKIRVKRLVRTEDLFAWKFAKKGFFKFKENIPAISKFINEPRLVWK